MKSKIILFIITWFSITTSISCLMLFSSGGDIQVNYVIEDFELSNVQVDTTNYRIKEWDIENQRDSNLLYGIWFHPINREISEIKTSQLFYRFNLINSAYATSATEISYKLINPIDSIKIITLNDFDTTHQKNYCINEFFSFMEFNNGNIMPVNNKLNFFLNSFEEPTYRSELEIVFILNKKMTSYSDLELKIEVYFRDLTIISKTITQNESIKYEL